MAFRFFIIVYLFKISTCFSQLQDTIPIQNNKIKDTISVQKTINRDASVEDNTRTVKVIEAETDSTSISNLKDLEFALKLDEAWFEELYSNRLFDTIYKSVTELDYQPVDYPELATDTLKARLKALDARTPFNVAYNPSLESVIKSYLKHRRKSIQNLLTLSAFYFPMFEGELDKHDILYQCQT